MSHQKQKIILFCQTSLECLLVLIILAMLQDKIQLNVLKINKLTNEKQPSKYIIPLFFNAIKLIHNDYNRNKVDPLLIEQVISKFKTFSFEHQTALQKLDQVHSFMLEECIQMLGAKHMQGRSEIKKSKDVSKMLHEINCQYDQDIIIIPQKTYFLDENYQLRSRSNSYASQFDEDNRFSKILTRYFSKSFLPDYQTSQIQVDGMWQNIEKLYREHRLDQAKLLCQKFQNNQFICNPNSKLSQQKYELIEQIYQQQKLMQHYYDFFNQVGYKYDKTQKGVSMFYRVHEETKQVSVRIQAQLDISVDRFVCIVSEVDLFDKVVPFSYDTRELKQVARNARIGTTKVSVPLLSNREAYFYAVAYDRLQTKNSIFFFSKTISSDKQYQRKLNYPIKLDPDLVELQYKFYIIQYIPLSLSRGKIRLATNIDMKMGFLPLFVINKSLRIFAFDYFQNLVDVNKKFTGSLWQKRMKERPYIYEFFKYRIQHFLYSKRS